MIRYSCDLCKRDLDPKSDLRYAVKIEVHAAVDPQALEACDDDRDHLQEIHESLESMDDLQGDPMEEDGCRKLCFDLCAGCAKKFLKDPLGCETVKVFDFSKN